MSIPKDIEDAIDHFADVVGTSEGMEARRSLEILIMKGFANHVHAEEWNSQGWRIDTLERQMKEIRESLGLTDRRPT